MKFPSFLLVAICFFLLSIPAARAAVVINEIMYNSPGSPDVEWIELYNSGPSAVEVDDWYLIDSNELHPHCVLTATIPAGGFLVVAGDFALFNAQYPGVTDLNPTAFDPAGTGFGLGNGGDTIFMYDDDGELVDMVAYDDGGAWPGSPDGDGPSLELVNPNLDNNTPTAWDGSLVDWGTPGQVNSTYQDNQAPIIHDTDRTPKLPQVADDVLITALVSDASDLDRVELFVDLGAGFVSRPMFDDGAHGDGAAADSLFAATIEAQGEGSVVHYYVAAYDDFGNVVTKPSDAPASSHAYTVGYRPAGTLAVSEVMASNVSTLADESGEFDDWVEITNGGTEAADLGGMFLTDNFGSHRKWMLPETVLAPSGRLLVWCDNQPEQGSLHATFKLSGGGEEIALYDTEEHGNTRLSGFHFGIQNDDVSFGLSPVTHTSLPVPRSENFMEPEYLLSPTPGAENDLPSAMVVINEFQTTSEAGGIDDWIEFWNRSDTAVDISGWGLSDDLGNPLKWVFPVGTVLAAQDFLVVDEATLGFSLSSSGELIQLSSADGLTGIDFLQFGQQTADISYGRSDVYSYWTFYDPPTPGETNFVPGSAVQDDLVPEAMRVTGAFPNPFNPMTTIKFDLPRQSAVTVDVFGLDGRVVRHLVAAEMAAGPAEVVFNGLDDQGRGLASGTFFARVQTGSAVGVVKLMLVK